MKTVVCPRFSRSTTAHIALPDVHERVVEPGYDVVMSSPQQFAAEIAAEVEKWAKIVKAAGIEVNQPVRFHFTVGRFDIAAKPTNKST